MKLTFGTKAVLLLVAGTAVHAETEIEPCTREIATAKSLAALDALSALATVEPQLAQQLAAELQADVNAALIAAGDGPFDEVCTLYEDMVHLLSPDLGMGRLPEPSG